MVLFHIQQVSLSSHPQIDGQSETVLDLLKCYVTDQRADWEKFLPLVEYAYNNIVHSSTGKTPFEVIYGKVLLPPILRTKDQIFAVDEYVRDLDTAYAQVKQAIARSQEKQKKPQTSIDVLWNLSRINGFSLSSRKLAFDERREKRAKLLSLPIDIMALFKSLKR